MKQKREQEKTDPKQRVQRRNYWTSETKTADDQTNWICRIEGQGNRTVGHDCPSRKLSCTSCENKVCKSNKMWFIDQIHRIDQSESDNGQKPKVQLFSTVQYLDTKIGFCKTRLAENGKRIKFISEAASRSTVIPPEMAMQVKNSSCQPMDTNAVNAEKSRRLHGIN